MRDRIRRVWIFKGEGKRKFRDVNDADFEQLVNVEQRAQLARNGLTLRKVEEGDDTPLGDGLGEPVPYATREMRAAKAPRGKRR